MTEHRDGHPSVDVDIRGKVSPGIDTEILAENFKGQFVVAEPGAQPPGRCGQIDRRDFIPQLPRLGVAFLLDNFVLVGFGSESFNDIRKQAGTFT